MLLPQEIAAKSVIPALRAIVVRDLIKRHGLTQEQVAKKLGITQAAVSNYVRRTRGVAIRLENIVEVKKATGDLASSLAKGELSQPELLRRFSIICDYIKGSRLMCELHGKLEPDLDYLGCHVCDNPEAGLLLGFDHEARAEKKMA